MKSFLIILLVISSFFDTGNAYVAEGRASYYADRLHGARTASGEPYNKHEFTAAHATLPFNTMVEVTNITNGKTVVVKINDRIPNNKVKVIDLSRSAARALGMIQQGIVNVKLRVLKDDEISAALPPAP